MTDALAPGAAARLLGVALSALRSWDRRYGIGPRVRGPGGHRRYSPADTARLLERCRQVGGGVPSAEAARRIDSTTRTATVPEPRAASPGGPVSLSTVAVPAGGHEHTPTPQGPARAAMRMDPDLVDHLLQTAVARNGTVAPGRTWRCPCCTAWGRRWEATQRYVEVEHLLS